MNESRDLDPSEEYIEEIRDIRRRLFSTVGTDYEKLAELGRYYPPGFRRLTGVRPVTPLSVQLAELEAGESPSEARDESPCEQQGPEKEAQ